MAFHSMNSAGRVAASLRMFVVYRLMFRRLTHEGQTSVLCMARDVGRPDRDRFGGAVRRLSAEHPEIASAPRPGGEAGLNTLCAGYQPFFQHIDDALRVMTTEVRFKRAPASTKAFVGAANRG